MPSGAPGSRNPKAPAEESLEETRTETQTETVDAEGTVTETSRETDVLKLGGGSVGGHNGSADFTAYPVLTEEVSLASSPTGFTAGRAGDIGTRASAAIQQVLSWRPNGDGRAFNAALKQSIQLDTVEGHVEWRYTPRGYAARADLGAVTGAQASLVQRSRTMVTSVIKPLIQSLTPLWSGASPEDYESLRRLVLQEADAIVGELGQEGGPRIQYVDDMFRQLLGANVIGQLTTKSGDPIARALVYGNTLSNGTHSAAQGHLYKLQERMGLNRSNVLTVNDEGIVTSFLTAADAVAEMYMAYYQVRDVLRPSFGSTSVQPFLGTQLIWVARAFASVSDATKELVFALDSVFVDATERQIIEIGTGSDTISLAETIDWLLAVAGKQGPQAIQDAGIDGLMAMHQTLQQLQLVVAETVNSQWDGAMATARVKSALAKVGRMLDRLTQLTGDIGLTAGAESAMESRPIPMAPPSE